ncbi:hypothetical protein C8J57DRAFT_1230347 [Mycena rebaudengoi]|nr:hypothetical protein C8J57DRAFT_1230347 [Mycena rebaudengoi]
MARAMYKLFGIFLVVSLALFFGLFFGLNYPGILFSLGCRTTIADPVHKNHAAWLASHALGYSPTACSANSSSCPPQIGSICDGGYCIDITAAIPVARHASLAPQAALEPRRSAVNPAQAIPRDGTQQNVSYAQDFSKDVNKADDFSNRHTTNRTSFLLLQPSRPRSVLFDVSFTRWKWAITAVFGMLPLTITLGLFAYFLAVLLLWNLTRSGWSEMGKAARAKPFLAKISLKRRTATTGSGNDPNVVENPPPEYKERDGANA